MHSHATPHCRACACRRRSRAWQLLDGLLQTGLAGNGFVEDVVVAGYLVLTAGAAAGPVWLMSHPVFVQFFA